jgi:C-terminal processing protease CtpA/Prc
MKMRESTLLLTLLLLAGCSAAPEPDESGPGIEIEGFMYEVPRIPHPGYHKAGVIVRLMEGGSAWAAAGVQVGDVIETVNGEPTLDETSFWERAGRSRPRQVRIASSRAGMWRRCRLLTIEVTAG